MQSWTSRNSFKTNHYNLLPQYLCVYLMSITIFSFGCLTLVTSQKLHYISCPPPPSSQWSNLIGADSGAASGGNPHWKAAESFVFPQGTENLFWDGASHGWGRGEPHQGPAGGRPLREYNHRQVRRNAMRKIWFSLTMFTFSPPCHWLLVTELEFFDTSVFDVFEDLRYTDYVFSPMCSRIPALDAKPFVKVRNLLWSII